MWEIINPCLLIFITAMGEVVGSAGRWRAETLHQSVGEEEKTPLKSLQYHNWLINLHHRHCIYQKNNPELM